MPYYYDDDWKLSEEENARRKKIGQIKYYAGKVLFYAGIGVAMTVLFLLCFGKGNVPEVKAASPEVWQQAGFEVIGYEGYTRSHCWYEFGCGHVWHTLRRIPDNGIIYHGYIEKWGDEFHIYNLTAIDAIKPK